MLASSSARRPACTRPAKLPSSVSVSFAGMSRRYFGTDGVRGIVGVDLNSDLVEKAMARGIASAGGTALLGGVLPTPAVAFLAEDLGVVVSASHNPPEYNGVKVLRGGR